MAYQSFEQLEVWQISCRLAVAINHLFQDNRNFALRDQIIRSSISVPSNIAEGSERGSAKDFQRFLHIAKGSCAELRTQLCIARKLDLISKAAFNQHIDEAKRISAMLQKLIQSLGVAAPKT